MSLSACCGHIQKKFFCKRTVLDVLQDLLHGCFGLFRNQLRSGDVIPVLSGVGNRISHSLEAGLIDQIHNQLHLVNTLKICISRIIACFGQSLITRLHQCAYTAAQHCLLAEQVGLGLGTESSLQNACPCTADRQCISQSHLQRFSGRILMNRYQTRYTFARLILTSYSMPGSFRSDHGNIYVLRRHDLIEMNVKAMGKHEHVAFFQIRLNILFVHGSLQFIVDQDHDDICLLCSLGGCIYLKALFLCTLPGSAALIKPDDHVASGLFCIQRMRMSLTAVADDCDRLPFQHGKVTVFLIINLCHCFSPPSS